MSADDSATVPITRSYSYSPMVTARASSIRDPVSRLESTVPGLDLYRFSTSSGLVAPPAEFDVVFLVG
eukprot:gene20688-23496_t